MSNLRKRLEIAAIETAATEPGFIATRTILSKAGGTASLRKLPKTKAMTLVRKAAADLVAERKEKGKPAKVNRQELIEWVSENCTGGRNAKPAEKPKKTPSASSSTKRTTEKDAKAFYAENKGHWFFNNRSNWSFQKVEDAEGNTVGMSGVSEVVPAAIAGDQKTLNALKAYGSKLVYTTGIQVSKNAQGQGYGTQLVKSAMATAEKAGKALALTSKKGSKAYALYVKLGFEDVGRTEEGERVLVKKPGDKPTPAAPAKQTTPRRKPGGGPRGRKLSFDTKVEDIMSAPRSEQVKQVKDLGKSLADQVTPEDATALRKKALGARSQGDQEKAKRAYQALRKTIYDTLEVHERSPLRKLLSTPAAIHLFLSGLTGGEVKPAPAKPSSPKAAKLNAEQQRQAWSKVDSGISKEDSRETRNKKAAAFLKQAGADNWKEIHKAAEDLRKMREQLDTGRSADNWERHGARFNANMEKLATATGKSLRKAGWAKQFIDLFLKKVGFTPVNLSY